MVAGEHVYLMLTLCCNDCIRLIDAPHNVITVIRDSIVQYWFKGLQNEQSHSDVSFFVLFMYLPLNYASEPKKTIYLALASRE